MNIEIYSQDYLLEVVEEDITIEITNNSADNNTITISDTTPDTVYIENKSDTTVEVYNNEIINITATENINTIIEVRGEQGDKGNPGEGVPEGGLTGEVLTKKTNNDYDTEWKEIEIPEQYIEITMANLKTLVDSSSLQPKQWYLITDFRNKTQIASSNEVKTGDVEQIYVQADSISTLNPRAYSKTYLGEELTYRQVVPTIVEDKYLEYDGGSQSGDAELTVESTDEFSLDVDIISNAQSFGLNYYNYNTGTYQSWELTELGTGWTWDNNTKTFTNLKGVIINYYTEYYDGEPSSLNITPTGEYTFTCDTDEIDSWTNGYIYVYDNNNEAGGEIYAEERGVTWDYDVNTHTFTLLSGASFYDDFSFENDVYMEINLEIETTSDFDSDNSYFYLETTIPLHSFENGCIVGRKNIISDFFMEGDYRSQEARKYKVLCNDWSAGTTPVNTVVRYSGNIWLSLIETIETPSTSSKDWIIVCYDDYFLSNTGLYFSNLNGGVTLNYDENEYQDYPIINTSFINYLDNSKPILNLSIYNYSNNIFFDTVFINLSQSSNSIIYTSRSVLKESIIDSNIYVIDSVLVNNISNSKTKMTKFFTTSFIDGMNITSADSIILNGVINSTSISYFYGVCGKQSFNRIKFSYIANTHFLTSVQNLDGSFMNRCYFYNNIDKMYFASVYDCNFMHNCWFSQFFADCYYTNFNNQVLRNTMLGVVYGTSNAVRQRIPYFADNFFAGSMTLSYFNFGVNINNNVMLNGMSNMFTNEFEASVNFRFNNNLCGAKVSYYTGTGAVRVYENVFLNGSVNLKCNNGTTYFSSLRGNVFLGQHGATNTGMEFNSTTEAAHFRFNTCMGNIFSHIITRGIIENNVFQGYTNSVTWGNTNTFTFKNNTMGTDFSTNTINASMEGNVFPASYKNNTLSSSNAFNFLSINNAYGEVTKYSTGTPVYDEIDGFLAISASSGNKSVTLKALVNSGRVLTVVKTDNSANTVTINRAGSDTIEGVTSIVLSYQYELVTLIDLGSTLGWKILSHTFGYPSTLIPFADSANKLTTNANLSYNNSTEELASTLFKGAYKSSDTSAGITQTITFNDYNDETHTLIFKDGILTSYTAP